MPSNFQTMLIFCPGLESLLNPKSDYWVWNCCGANFSQRNWVKSKSIYYDLITESNRCPPYCSRAIGWLYNCHIILSPQRLSVWQVSLGEVTSLCSPNLSIQVLPIFIHLLKYLFLCVFFVFFLILPSFFSSWEMRLLFHFALWSKSL